MDDQISDRRMRGDGPPWPVLPRSAGPEPFATLPGVLTCRGAVSWYVGGSLSSLWLIGTGREIVREAGSAASASLGIVLLIVFALAFLISIPVGWSLSAPLRILPPVAQLALSFTLFPWLSWDVRDTWTFIGVALGMMVMGWRVTLLGITTLAVGAVWFGVLLDGWGDDDLWLPAIIFSISLMMAAFANAFASMNQLRATQKQLENLAAERERNRLARDIHDILGHSLTVITVKSELANRLIDGDPDRAKTEVAEIEQLARGALADVRTTVAGARGVTLTGELAAARAALEAAGIAAEIPSATDAVSPAHRQLAGWVVREGITNVLRHSQATRCAVRLSARQIEVADDGVGPIASDTSSTGLTGLRERVHDAGGTLSIGRSDLGGFSLKVVL